MKEIKLDISKLDSGFMHDSYLIEAGGERIVLQKLNKTFDSIPDIDKVSKFLIDKKFPTIEVLDNYRITKYIYGVIEDKPNDVQFISALQLVGKFHNTIQEYNAPIRKDIHSVRELRKNYKKLDKLPKRVIHGDLKPLNFLFKGNTAIALLDLDYVHKNTIVWDIANLICSWCGCQTGKIVPRRIEIIKKQYSSWSLLTEEEIGMIDYCVKVFALEFYYRYKDYDYFNKLSKEYCDKRSQNALKFYESFNRLY